MGNTSPDNIFFPDPEQMVGQVRPHLATQAASVQAAITGLRSELDAAIADIHAIPDPVTSLGSNVQAISASSWSSIPGITPITMNFSRPAWVQVNLYAWVVASSGDLRAGVNLTGATVQSPPQPAWGNTIYKANGGAQTSSERSSKMVLVNAGSTTFTPQAYQSGGGTKQLNYSMLEVIPLRWDTPPS